MNLQQLQKQQKPEPRSLVKSSILPLLLTVAALSLFTQLTSTSASAAVSKKWLAEEPVDGRVGQVYYNTTINREFIYNGQEWVPHDDSIDTYVLKKDKTKVKVTRLTTADAGSTSLLSFAAALGGSSTPASPTNFCLDSSYNNLCPDDIHTRHQKVMNDCQGCHNLSSSFNVTAAFFKDSSKPAFISGGPAPLYTPSGNWSSTPTAIAATCSNIACHSVPTSTFSYYFPGGDGEPELRTVTTGGISSAKASWQSSSITSCNSCHGNPPGGEVWHSGYHGSGLSGNVCELCHPDAKSTVLNGQITSNFLTVPGIHKNGTLDVLARYKSACFGCH